MEKHKIDLSKYADMHEEKTITGKDNTEVVVRDHIPYEQKEVMATEMAERVLMEHDDSCMYTSNAYDKVEKYLLLKYYTNVDVEEEDIDNVVDFMVNNEIIGDIIAFVWNDFDIVLDIFERIESSLKKTYEDDHSLTKAIRTSFGFLFTGEDITESMAKAEATSGVLMDALNALRDADKKKEETIDKGKLTVGGNIINFAKKKE